MGKGSDSVSMKPILFNTDMVRAILEGRKTVTRRVVMPQPKGEVYQMPQSSVWPNYWGQTGSDAVFAPKYHHGDILYVRETWCRQPSEEFPFVYRASVQTPDAWRGSWHPSIHMPKEAARIFLRVTDVRVERLQDITSADVKSEGAAGRFGATRGAFETLWDSTIRPAELALYGWTANPWVWVIEFERCGKPEVQV